MSRTKLLERSDPSKAISASTFHRWGSSGKVGHCVLLILLLVTIVLRTSLIFTTQGTIDVLNYARVANIVLSLGPFSLYKDTQGIYPYPPMWVWFEVAAHLVSLTKIVSFPVAVRLPAILAEAGIVHLIWCQHANHGPKNAALWCLAYVLNPVSIIVTSLHGQFDAIPVYLMLLSAYTLSRKRRLWLSAIVLGLAICFKPFPVLILPIFVSMLPSSKLRIVFSALSLAPVALLLSPFLLHSPGAVMKELFGYQGVGLLGILVPIRIGYTLLASSKLPVEYTEQIISLSRWLFLATYTVLTLSLWNRPMPIYNAMVIVFSLFYLVFAGISPQYLLWIVPLLWFANISHPRLLWGYLAAATLALLAFYQYGIPQSLPFTIHSPRSLNVALYGLCGSIWWLANGILLITLLRHHLMFSYSTHPVEDC